MSRTLSGSARARWTMRRAARLARAWWRMLADGDPRRMLGGRTGY